MDPKIVTKSELQLQIDYSTSLITAHVSAPCKFIHNLRCKFMYEYILRAVFMCNQDSRFAGIWVCIFISLFHIVACYYSSRS